jgi:hypothetical protein
LPWPRTAAAWLFVSEQRAVLTLREQLDIQVLANASFTVLNAALAGDNYRALGVETDLFKEVAN